MKLFYISIGLSLICIEIDSLFRIFELEYIKRTNMRIAIVGIGGIGGYIGSKLCKAYATGTVHEIVFVQRGEHYRKIKESGLCYVTKNETIVSPNEIFESTENAGLFDVIFITVKSRDLEDAARSIQANLHADSVVISTLNGVDNAKRIQTVLPDATVLNGCIYVSAAIESPGVVRQTGGVGNLYFGSENGEVDPYVEIETLLIEAGIKAVLTEAITKAVWEKYIFICSWASISSRYALPVGAILADEAKCTEWRSLLQEIANLGKCLKVGLSDHIVEQCMERFAQLPYENKTSMQLDIEAGKIAEIDSMTKYVVDRSEALGLAVPAHLEVLRSLEN